MKYFTISVFTILFFCGIQNLKADAPCNCAPQSDSLELVKLYQNLNGPNWINNTNWLVPGMPIDTWYGVLTNGGCVIAITLPSNGLSGELFDINLPELTSLFFSDNQLSGSIPDFSHIPKLTRLLLDVNQLSGQIPNFSNLPDLLNLDLFDNQLSGQIPNFSNLPNLFNLDLAINQLSGQIPNFSHIPSLLYLDLLHNQLSGSIPDFSNLPVLKFLRLSQNQLSGSIPDFSYIPDVQNLTLSMNQLSGSIPDFSNLPNLSNLDLNGNQLSGSIPDFNNLPNLTRLYFFYNQLSGSIPDFSNLSNLLQLDLRFNQLSGSIPEFSNLPNLSLLYLSGNQLFGSIPDFSNLPNLLKLDLGSNQLFGSIPDFSNLSNLSTLDLSRNQLSGSIPDFSNLSNLATLDLNGNQLTGSIPDFSNLPNLSKLYLFYNQLSGSIPDFSSLPNLSQLIINDNEFNGTVPFLGNLSRFDIHNNRYQFNDFLGTGNLSIPAFIYAPQKLIFQDTVIYTNNSLPLIIDLGIDHASGSVYTWSKDSTAWTPPPGNDPGAPLLQFLDIQVADAGRYNLSVTNPAAPNLTLHSYTISLRVCVATSDSLQLVSLYNSTGGPGWTNQTNWLVPGQPISTWYGVTISSLGCVQKLDLTANNLVGELPALDLNTLDTLVLENNQLTNHIPELKMPFLKAFNLSRNNLSGGFPASLTTWYDLRALNLSNNTLDSTIPPDLGDLCELTSLNLSNNALVGELPEQLTMLFNLQVGEVDFSNNQIDSLKEIIIFFCPYGSNILDANPSTNRFLGICNQQCSGSEWDQLNAFPWIGDTLANMSCNINSCQVSLAQAGYVDVRGVRVVFTHTRCYTLISPIKYSSTVRFFDCAGNLLEKVVYDQDENSTSYGVFSADEFNNLEYDVRWQCGLLLQLNTSVSEPGRGDGEFRGGIKALQCTPNPADLVLTCAGENQMLYPATLEVFDLLGRPCAVGAETEGENIRLDVGGLKPGMYIVTLLGEQGRYVAKVVVK